MNSGWTYRNQVDDQAQGLTVLDYYTQHYRHSSRVEWQSRIIAGQILLDGTQTTAETHLSRGQWLTYHRPPWREPEVPLSFEVLHEDAELLVVAKPAGLPVLPGGGFLEHTLLWQLQQRYPQSTPAPIHRLGRGTSGLMLLARSPQTRAGLSQQMRDRQIRKTYRAIAQAVPDTLNTFVVTQPIGKVPHPVLGDVYAATAEGLPAHSECQVLKRSSQTTLLEVTILTGRPHQIRIHLAAVGYPLWGDRFYGIGGTPLPAASNQQRLPLPGDCGYHLHALQLAFVHPSSGRSISLTCPAPPELDF